MTSGLLLCNNKAREGLHGYQIVRTIAGYGICWLRIEGSGLKAKEKLPTSEDRRYGTIRRIGEQLLCLKWKRERHSQEPKIANIQFSPRHLVEYNYHI
jgi:hypothetical protein